MISTSQMLRYLDAHATRRVVNLPQNDPALAQAIADGYADWDGAAWVLVAHIRPGDRRLVRFDDGTTQEVRG